MNSQMLLVMIGIHILIGIVCVIAAWELICFIARHLTISIGWI